MLGKKQLQIWIRKFVDVCLLETQKKVDDRAGTKLRKYLATRGIFWAWSQSSCRLFSEFGRTKRPQIFWFKFEVVFSRLAAEWSQNSFNGMVVVSGHLQPASGSTRTFLWLWMGGWSDKWHTQVLQHDYDEGVGERVGWENVPKIHQKLLKMAPISSDVVRRTCV